MRRTELINKASNLALIYLLFNYWVTPLYLLLDKLISDGKLFDNISKYGEIKFIPFPIEKKLIDIGDYHSNISLAKQLLMWKPVTGLKKGLNKTLDYYFRNYKNYI